MHQQNRTFLTIRLVAWTLVLLIFAPSCFAITIDAQQQLDYADRLFSEKQYLRAAEAYQRFAFFFKDHPLQRTIVYKSGESFLLAGDATTAMARFKGLAASPVPDTLSVDADFMVVECYLKLNAPTQAGVHLHNIITKTDDRGIKDRAYHRLAWLHIHYTDWKPAQDALARISPSNRLHYRSDEIAALLENSASIPRKHPAVAGTLSIIPGAGQLYCSRYEDALIAFLLNVGLIWAASDAFDQDQPALGGLLSFVGLGFYFGNIYGAVTDAHKYNQNRQAEYVDRLKPFLVREVAPPAGASTGSLLFSLHVPF